MSARRSRRAGADLRRSLVSATLLLAGLLASPASAVTVGIDLLVGIQGQPCPASLCTADGGPDEAGNVPLDLLVSGGDVIDVFVRITFGLPMRLYTTAIDVETSSLIFVEAEDLSTLGFSGLADPNATLADGSPEAGDADSELCIPNLCVAPSTNVLYRLRFQVDPGFVADGLRDLTVNVESILFDRAEDDLDPQLDTASLRLVPEPGSGLLLLAGLAGLAVRRRGRP